MITTPLYKGHCFVFTGGPGAGKTSVIEVLEQKGYPCIPEVARQIIRQQVASNGPGVPWKDMQLYTQLMQEQTIAVFDTAPSASAGPCFFDRGLPDVICHAQLNDLPVDPELKTATYQLRYNQQVFLFPPWEEIYQTDAERKQSFETAIATYEVLKNVYRKYDYVLVEVPKMSIADRVEFVLEEAQKY
ncbi:AAA family ATPase [uncultured Chitinophaga sp.]|jgi:Predicted ATPase|uniref:AAA family ATPase n=1 Tax=uncultured Chitinophaga sp. TaxID=339340 RepID=UPI00261A72F0|nr:AAA family ATPase [uncultured Chitinophaga sp.]